MAVATIVASRAARNIESISATRIGPRWTFPARVGRAARSVVVTRPSSQDADVTSSHRLPVVTDVATATGTVDSASLGRVLMHEHVFVITTEVQQNHDEWDEEERVADAVEKLRALKAAGFDTIVDPTVIGLGRYIPRIVRIAQQVDLNIVVATGVYTYEDVPFFFHHRGPALDAALGTSVPDPMVDMFVRDIEEGIAGTG